MQTKLKEQQPSLTNASEHHNSNSNLVERKPIEGTPFTIIKQIMDNDKPLYFLVMGDHRLTEPTRTEEETLEKIITEHWQIITTVVAIIVEKTLEIKSNTIQFDKDPTRNYSNLEPTFEDGAHMI